MALNPFFQQGTQSEQGLVQDLIDEQIAMFGVEFVYMPRVFVNTKTIMREVSSSKFDRSFPIEGYIESHDGFDSNYNLLTKFGVRSTAEMKIVISQERYNNYVLPMMAGQRGLSKNPTRPLEGDLLYFPFRDLLLEIKYVDDVSTFYQLRKNYTYTLHTEPFEYEDEVIATGIETIDDDMKTAGYNATLTLLGIGNTAQAYTSLTNGVASILLTNGGSGYTASPEVRISAPIGGGVTATAVAITTTSTFHGRRVSSIYVTNPGTGYTMSPSISFHPEDGVGSGAAAVVGVATNSGGVGIITITDTGSDYIFPPDVTFSPAPAGGRTATGEAFLWNDSLYEIRVTNPGYGYTVAPTITVGHAGTTGIGTFKYGNWIQGRTSLSTAFVTSYDAPTLTLTARNLSGNFSVGELIVNNDGAQYRLNTINYDDTDDAFNSGVTIETEADSILDFTEKNPFGEV